MRTSPRVKALQYLALLGYLAFLLVPVAWLLSTAFKTPEEITSSGLNWIPIQPTFENFVTGFTEVPLVRSLLNSILISSVSAVLTIVISVPAAYVMARHRGLLSNVAMGWVIVSQLFPFILVLIPLFLLVIQLGLYNTHIGLIAVYVVWSLPFAMWMLRSYVSSIPVELEHAAAIDGAGQFRILKDVIAPLLLPGCVAAGMFAFVSSWNEFFFALVMLNDSELDTISLMIVRFVGADGAVRMGPLAAVAILATIPSLVFFGFMQRHLVSGLMGGSMKG
jgi:multiple sugar transport system permease protein